MYQITKRFEFSAAHRVLNLPPGHQCGRLHGHNYVVEVVVTAPSLDGRGFAQVDYGEMKPFKDWLDDTLDHRTILSDNDALAGWIEGYSPESVVRAPFNPTAENLAKYLLGRARELVGPFVSEVRVSETPKTWACYRAPN